MPVSTRRSAGSAGTTKSQQSKLNFGAKKPASQTAKSIQDVVEITPQIKTHDKAVLVQSLTPPGLEDAEEVRLEDDEAEKNEKEELNIENAVKTDEKEAQVHELEQDIDNDETSIFQEQIVERSNVLPIFVSKDQEAAASKITDKAIKQYYKDIQDSRIGPTVHQEQLSEYEKILRYFDLSSQYGPCVGITRFKRWNRAQRLGLEPPIEVLAVLIKVGLREGLKPSSSEQDSASVSDKEGVGAVAYVNELLATHTE